MIVAAAKGKICIWPGSVLPPLMVYLRKQPVPEKLKDGAIPNTLFVDSDWINSQLYLERFKISFRIYHQPLLLPVMWWTLSISVYAKKRTIMKTDK